MTFTRYERLLLLPVCLILASVASLGAQDPGASGEARFLSNTHQLTYEGKRAGEAYFSPDGNAMIFQSEREPGNPFFQIYLLDLKTGDSHRVSPGAGKTTCSFFRNGSDEVLFASTHLDPDARKKQKEEIELRASGKSRRYSWDYDATMDIFSARRDGKKLRRLTDAPGYDAEGSYSPDGRKIVFCSLRGAYAGNLSPEERKRAEKEPSYFGEIYIMNADGSGQTRLTNTPGYDGGPFFTPDGQRIVWRRFDESGVLADIYTMRLDGSDVRRITDFKAMSWAPYFHPSGEYLLFASNKLGFGNFEIYMVDAEGKHEPVRVTFTDGFDGLPVFSPDGAKLAWTSRRTSNRKSQVFMAGWNHEAALAALSSAPLRIVSGNEAKQLSSDGHGSAPLPTTAAATDGAADRQFSPEIKAADLNASVKYLASDELGGRMSGSAGERLAAKFIIDRFKEARLRPLFDDGKYRQEFRFTAGVKLAPEGNALQVTPDGARAKVFKVNEDFRPLAFSENGEVEAPVVFAGYGLSVSTGKAGGGYDSYSGLDVKDKFVLVLRYVPEEVSMERRQALNRYAGLRYKAMIARERGAKGLLAVTGPTSPGAGKLAPLKSDQSSAGSGILVASVSRAVADALFAGSGKTLAEVQAELDKENPHYEGQFDLPGVKARMRIDVERIKKPAYNIAGILPGSGPAPRGKIVIGAHYDHLGHGEAGSLGHKGEEGRIHNGADDNASGTAAVLELAAALSEKQRKNPRTFSRDIVFALWSGEELGIVGSSDFVDAAPFPLDQIAAYMNFDMVGRLSENKLILQGVGSSSIWRKLIEKRNVVSGFDLVLQDDPYQPTDITSFYTKKIPVLSFFTGSHEDYHRPTDDFDKINYGGLERIARFAGLLARDLASEQSRPDYVKVERVKSASGSRESMRAYLGTIPDYVTDGSGGVKLSGVSGGGPADKAGLQSGDIIIRLAGKNITNIYDYTYALDALKIGEPVEIVVVRDAEEVTLKIVPGLRE